MNISQTWIIYANDIHIISCGTVQYKSKNCCSNKACPPITLLYILYIGVMPEYILSCVQDNLYKSLKFIVAITNLEALAYITL